MDSNQNLDGLDGLPHDVWMNQMQQQHLASLHPNLSSVYHHSQNAQAMQGYLSPRTLPAVFSTEESVLHMGRNPQMSSSALQQYSVTSSARQTRPELVTTAQERSAWSHLISLDPSMASFGSHLSGAQESARHMHNRYMPQDTHAQNARSEPPILLKSSACETTHPVDSVNLPRLQFSSPPRSSAAASLGSYTHMTSQNQMSQHLNQLMNLSKKIANAGKPTASKALTISTDVPSQESSGGYSPVSPPATEIDELPLSSAGHNPGRVAELLLREPHDGMASSHPLFPTSDQSDVFPMFSEKRDTCPSDFSTLSGTTYTRSSHSVATSGMMVSPSDVPLDMTTALASKPSRSWLDESVPKDFNQINTDSSASTYSTISERSPLLQTLLSKGQPQGTDGTVETHTDMPSSDRKPLQQSFSDASQQKTVRTVKSTPKKSNFYGRDASLFSFASPSSNHTVPSPVPQFSESSVATMENGKELNSAMSLKCSVEGDKVLDNATFSFGPDAVNHADEKCADVTTDASSLKIAEDHTSEPLFFDSNGAVPEHNESSSVVGHDPLFSQNDDILTEGTNKEKAESHHEETVMDTSTEENKIPEITGMEELGNPSTMNFESCNGLNSMHDASHEAEETSENNCDQEIQEVDMPNETDDSVPFISTTPTKLKTPKRKKRKATGFQTKPRKKATGKKAKVKKGVAFKNPSQTAMLENDTGLDADTGVVSGSHDVEDETHLDEISQSHPSLRKQTAAKERALNTDQTPRRSSSRKSKDNAMRLIELQADSNYTGVPDSPEVGAVKKTRKRAASLINPPKIYSEEPSDLSEDDDSEDDDKSDEKDGDYVVDEEEAEALDNEESLAQQNEIKKKPKEKRLGGLKISIKLSGNSSAEIVSGIEDSPAKKKRKIVKKKVKNKGKGKGKAASTTVPNIMEENLPESSDATNTREIKGSTVDEKSEETIGSQDLKDRHLTLMEKYFSTANSATATKQTQKGAGQTKNKKIKKTVLESESRSKAKLGKAGALKSASVATKKSGDENLGVKQKGSVKFKMDVTGEREVASKAKDAEVPKFVCGYCPQRYYNKQELLAHMEAHMTEMEGKDESEKETSTIGNPGVSRDPRAKRPSSATNETATVKAGASEKTVIKPSQGQVKDSNAKNVHVPVKQKFKCGECGQVFSSKPDLLDHVRIHTADKPFECDICHKCFTERNFLSAHRKTHVQDKLLRCHVCSKAFVHKTDLDVHMQSHPKRSNGNVSGRNISLKKSFKKDTSQRSPKEEPPSSKKPTSFASALSGEVDLSGKVGDAPAVLVLRRSDASTSDSKTNSTPVMKTAASEPKLYSKPNSSVMDKTNVTDKSTDNMTKSIDNSGVSSKAKKEESKEQSKVSENVQGNSAGKSSESAPSDVCTCKECPDCVTRFLQSFE